MNWLIRDHNSKNYMHAWAEGRYVIANGRYGIANVRIVSSRKRTAKKEVRKTLNQLGDKET